MSGAIVYSRRSSCLALTGSLNAIMAAARLFRPRTLALLAQEDDRLQQRIQRLEAEVTILNRRLTDMTLRERELRVMLDSRFGSTEQVDSFRDLLENTAIAAHTRGAISAAPLRLHPFPHAVVDNLLPPAYYDALIAAMPPIDLFGDRPDNKQQVVVPLKLAPRYPTEVWGHMAKEVAENIIGPALIDKFREPLSGWLRESFPALGDTPLDRIETHISDGRILLRRPGYRIPPHRDPKWGFITCLFYLARPGDDERWGTQMYTVEGDTEALGGQPHWVPDSRVHLAGEVAFKPNRAFVFLNSVGAHGAQIPADATPADLTRYAYQFRVGASRSSIEAIIRELPPAQRAFWAGKAGDPYA